MRTFMPVIFGLSCLHGMLIAAITKVAGSLEPRFNTTSERVTVTEGSRAILPCSVEYLGEQSVIWVNPRKILISHMDRRTIDDHRISVERPYIKEWNLLIRQVRYNDSGIYECRINTKPKQIKKITLAIQVPPMIVSELSSDRVSLEEGETATLICNVTGIPKPNVTWYKRNSRKPKGDKERIGTEGEVLVIHNVSRMCDDIYECFVDNGVPPAVSKAIRVTVDYAPEVQLSNRRIGQSLGRETMLDCIISANPQAVTEWRRDGRPLHKTDKYDIDVYPDEYENFVTLSLRIKNIGVEDYGKYVCVGSNHLGEDHEEMVVYEISTTTTTTTTTTTATTSTINTRNPEYRYDGQMSGHRDPNNHDRQHDPQGGRGGGDNSKGPYAQSREDDRGGNTGGTGGRGGGGGGRGGDGGGARGEPVVGQSGNPYQGNDNTWSVSRPDSGYPISKGHPVSNVCVILYVTLTAAVTSLLSRV